MKTRFPIILLLAVLISCASMKPEIYHETVAQWTSYKDVANWMSENVIYVHRGVGRWDPKPPEQFFRSARGNCADGANFARHALNRINPDYKAGIVFIKNQLNPPNSNHWVTVFTMDGKLYIMDYTMGHSWESMKGIHGPYDSLKEYEKFLSSLDIKSFKVQNVEYRDR